jgi:hypothetical protein
MVLLEGTELEIAMAPTKNTNRDKISPADQLEDPKRFKMTNWSQVDAYDD